jgi:ribosomal 50S subunit-recycling heat shock protein
MRVDLYLKLMGLTKTRMVAKRLCDAGWVLLNQSPLKPSHELLGMETLRVKLPMREIELKVTAIPGGKSLAKADRNKFVEILSTVEFE